MIGTNPFLPHEIWAATSLAAFRAAVDMTSTMATASASLMSTAAPSAPAERARSSLNMVQREPAPKARSWYKAPYRSPFDPLFWMSPGHPVDHVSDWLALMSNAGRAMPGLSAMPSAVFPGTSVAPATDAWLPPWLSFIETMTASLAATSKPAASDNVVDFASAYATYRTAGGHAAAQIINATSIYAPPLAPPVQATPAGFGAMPMWPFPMALFMPSWLR